MSESLRVSFLGNDRWSVPPLRAIAASRHRVVAVVTAEPKPAGRGNALTPTAVTVEAERLGLHLVQTPTATAGTGLEALVASAPNVLVVVAYGEILPSEVLRLPTIAPVNLHFSLLPSLRGAAPVRHALLAGLERTGVSTMVMDEGLDTGPILLQREEPIRPDDDAGSLGHRLAEVGGSLLVETLDRLAARDLEPREQDHGLATFAPKFAPEDRALDWSRSAGALVNLVRALSPEPGALTAFRGGTLKVLRAGAVDGSGETGAVVEVTKRGFVVATAEGGFAPLVLAPAGRRVMDVADFVNGHHPQVGERLG